MVYLPQNARLVCLSIGWWNPIWSKCVFSCFFLIQYSANVYGLHRIWTYQPHPSSFQTAGASHSRVPAGDLWEEHHHLQAVRKSDLKWPLLSNDICLAKSWHLFGKISLTQLKSVKSIEHWNSGRFPLLMSSCSWQSRKNIVEMGQKSEPPKKVGCFSSIPSFLTPELKPHPSASNPRSGCVLIFKKSPESWGLKIPWTTHCRFEFFS